MENLCLYCGDIVPEGRMVCPICEERLLSGDYYEKTESGLLEDDE